ncbi:Ni,Fe-hydrogenase III small subunit [Allokutzneria albata]|uniref:Ni,Fe-hydrogenase III small subunit n=1 Tax=Allokutzneria albata TaxID=211114 RepID=A0A1G9SC84_ALLAB|nr:Ni,Fe-hydrogenase III small subunit [Allokutzneria albata]
MAEPAPPRMADGPPEAARLGGSVQIRHVDAGSCNRCEVAIGSARMTPSGTGAIGCLARHADALVMIRPVTQNKAEPLRRTYDAAPGPKLVAVGDCARSGAAFADAYGMAGAVRDIALVDVEIAGCSPRPEAIVESVRKPTGR